MPVAGKIYTKRVDLTNYPEEAYVVLRTNPKVSDWEGFDTDNVKESQYEILARLMTEWNFTDEQGTVLPISAENIKNALSVFDITLISEQITPPQLSIAEKKS
jgi:hypothetical protein